MNIYYQKTHQRAFGTFPLEGEVAHNAILEAAKVGYRAFDTAQMYGNEAETGVATMLCDNPPHSQITSPLSMSYPRMRLVPQTTTCSRPLFPRTIGVDQEVTSSRSTRQRVLPVRFSKATPTPGRIACW